MHLFRIIRFFRLFRSLFAERGTIRLSGVKGEGQPTRCTHRVLPGLASACRPSNPAKAERPKP